VIAQCEIDAVERIAAAAGRIASRDDAADGRLLTETAITASHEDILGSETIRRFLSYGKHAQRISPYLAGESGARLQINGLAVCREPDGSRKKRSPILRQTAELEDFAVLEEEIPLLRKKQRKPREIDLTIVDVGRREVGVERECADERGRDAPESIERGLGDHARALRGEVLAFTEGSRRHEIETQALLTTLHAAKLAAHIERDASIALRPGDFLTLAAYGADEVDSPGVGVAIEGQRLEWNGDLGLPA